MGLYVAYYKLMWPLLTSCWRSVSIRQCFCSRKDLVWQFCTLPQPSV